MSPSHELLYDSNLVALPELVSRIEALEQRIEDLRLAFEMHVNAEHQQRYDDLAASVKQACLFDRLRAAAAVITGCEAVIVARALDSDVVQLAAVAHMAQLEHERGEEGN